MVPGVSKQPAARLPGVTVAFGPLAFGLLAFCTATALLPPVAPAAAQDAQPAMATGADGRFSLQCDFGQTLVGIRGQAGEFIDGISGLCAGRTGVVAETGARGGNGGARFEIRCDTGAAVTGLVGTRGTYVDSLSLECRPMRNNQPGGEATFTASVGGQGGQPFGPLRCPAGQVAIGLKGRAGTFVDELEPDCAAAKPAGATAAVWVSPAAGGKQGNDIKLTCGTDEVLVGTSTRNGNWLDAIAALCVRVSDDGNWTGEPRSTDHAGGAGGVALTRSCPRGQAVAGISGRSSNVVNQLVSECRPLVSAKAVQGPSQKLESVGGAGGDPFGPYPCPNNMPATGLKVGAGIYVDRVQVVCGRE